MFFMGHSVENYCPNVTLQWELSTVVNRGSSSKPYKSCTVNGKYGVKKFILVIYVCPRPTCI